MRSSIYLWQQLELAYELESGLGDTVDWIRKWLVDFNTGKTQLVLIDRSNRIAAIVLKIDASILEEKSPFKSRGWFSLLNWIGALT